MVTPEFVSSRRGCLACGRPGRTMAPLLDAAPLQIFSLFKLLAYPGVATPSGDGFELAFMQPPARGRVIVDIGLHRCESLIEAVQNGYVVHGFEPVPAHMAYCHRGLPKDAFFDVPIVRDSAGSWRAALEQRPQPSFRATNATHTRGFAYLYNCALGSEIRTINFTSANGSSSVTGSGHVPAKGVHAARMYVIEIPMLTLDSVIREDLWLLKIDVQGFESARTFVDSLQRTKARA